MYAVIDVDNTLRHGFTIYDWGDYLTENGLISKTCRECSDDIDRRYALGEFGHEDYARMAGENFAEHMRGIKAADVATISPGFVHINERFLFPYVRNLFKLLKRFDVKASLISGAPKEVMELYRDAFELDIIICYELEEKDGVFTGVPSRQTGTQKGKYLDKLIAHYGTVPLIGMGDSASDLPLLRAATLPVIVGNKYMPEGLPETTIRVESTQTELPQLEAALCAIIKAR